MNFKVGAFNSSGTSGNQSITGVGFQPKVLILFTVKGSGVNTSCVFDFGVATASQQRWIGFVSQHGFGVGDAAIGSVNDSMHHKLTTGGSLIGPSASRVSLDSDGFTISWSVGHTAYPLKYICLGGSDLTNVHLGTFTVPGSTGDQAYTGVGFQPDALWAFGITHTTINVGKGGTDPIGTFMGFTDGTDEGCQGHATDEGADPTNTLQWQRANRLITTLNGATGAVHNAASLVSLDSDGFTLNWDVRNASDIFFVLSLKGGSFKVGFENFKTSTGTQAYTGVGFPPKGMVFLSDGSAWDEL